MQLLSFVLSPPHIQENTVLYFCQVSKMFVCQSGVAFYILSDAQITLNNCHPHQDDVHPCPDSCLKLRSWMDQRAVTIDSKAQECMNTSLV